MSERKKMTRGRLTQALAAHVNACHVKPRTKRAEIDRALLDFLHKEGIEWEFGWEDEGFFTVTFFFEEDDNDDG